MVNKSFQRSIRFTKNEWDAVVEAAEKAGINPGSFVRKAAARAAADDLYLYGGGLTPELAALIERTFRGVYSLTWLKREELEGKGEGEAFSRTVASAVIAQDETMKPGETGTGA